MKLLIDARSLGQKPSGIGMYAYNFITSLRMYTPHEIALVTDVCESDEMCSLKERKIKIYEIGHVISKSVSLISYFRYIQRCIEEYKPDVFWEINNLFPIKIRNSYGKIITTIHDVFPITQPECFGKIYPLYFRYGVKNAIRYSDGIIYNSEDTRSETEKYFPNSMDKSSYVGYIIMPVLPKMQVERKDYFFYVGNLEKRKGTDLLLDAYEEYLKQGGTRVLVLAGKVREDDIRQKLDNMIEKYDKIKYLGYLSDEEKVRRYSECGCFLFLSRAEGFGMPVIEAIQCGAPVIASDLPVFHELVGESIQYCDVHDKKNMISCMMNIKEPIHEEYIRVIDKFNCKTLVCSLDGFLNDILHVTKGKL